MYGEPCSAMEDGLRMRAARDSVRQLYRYIAPTKLLVILLHIIEPQMVKPLLIDLRDELAGTSDDQFKNLIGTLSP